MELGKISRHGFQFRIFNELNGLRNGMADKAGQE
jgi:hypothetical protein